MRPRLSTIVRVAADEFTARHAKLIVDTICANESALLAGREDIWQVLRAAWIVIGHGDHVLVGDVDQDVVESIAICVAWWNRRIDDAGSQATYIGEVRAR